MINQTVLQRFMANTVVPLDPDGCWNWTGSKMAKSDYGRFGIKYDRYLAHRASWMLMNGHLPKNLCVLHKCDNQRCVNPRHLFLGTHQDNIADKVSKNRQHKGERSSLSKLTADDVRAIRNMAANGFIAQRIAEHFGIARSTAQRIIKREDWKHIQ